MVKIEWALTYTASRHMEYIHRYDCWNISISSSCYLFCHNIKKNSTVVDIYMYFRWHLLISRGFQQCSTLLTCLVPVDTDFAPAALRVIQCFRCYWPLLITIFHLRLYHRVMLTMSPSLMYAVDGPHVWVLTPSRPLLAVEWRPLGLSCRPTRPSWRPCRSAASWSCGACRQSGHCPSLVDSQNWHASTHQLCRHSQM